MFSHIMIGANDMEASKEFYDATLGVLGVARGMVDAKGRIYYVSGSGVLAITKPLDGEPATSANGETLGFSASSTELVDAWHAAGLAAGGSTCEDPPGVRDEADGRKLYLAYLRDPTGHKLCALYRMAA